MGVVRVVRHTGRAGPGSEATGLIDQEKGDCGKRQLGVGQRYGHPKELEVDGGEMRRPQARRLAC